MQSDKHHIGVILLNLGGPEHESEVQPFLYNLFSDREIIRLGPAFLQKPLARFIAGKRAAKSRENYRKIGGGSPIGRITARQAQALEQALAADGDFTVKVAMRYWHPSAEKTLASLAARRVDTLIALPLYPHYSRATTGSSLNDLQRRALNGRTGRGLITIKSWPTEPDYIRSLAGKINSALDSFGEEEVTIVYSAHSLPQKFIDEGDPYVRELRETITSLEALTGRRGQLCFQSRSGPVRWLSPSTPETIRRLAEQGCKNLLMVPISFVSDHVETLYEIDILYKKMARQLGMRLESTPGLNTDPLFIAALRNLVITALDRYRSGTDSNGRSENAAS